MKHFKVKDFEAGHNRSPVMPND